jgi:6-pyruvoyltetrahydropterin/6-carboxytetrahydropterin synthase
MDISIQTEVSIGHRLYGYPGKCSNLHGHNYNFEFVINGNPDVALGLVMDFKDLKATINTVLEPFDHAMVLMEGDPFEDSIRVERSKHLILSVNPSAENLASLMFNLLMNEGLKVCCVRVRETSDSLAQTDRVDRDVRIIRGAE